jgi:hypothetical protein
MSKPVLRNGEWWSQQQDGTWVVWDEQARRWAIPSAGGPRTGRVTGLVVQLVFWGLLIAGGVYLWNSLFESSGERADGLGADGLRVSRSEFGKDWPLTVEEGVLRCEGAGAVTISTGGTTYAVNGLAGGMDIYRDINAIWADNPQIPSTKQYIGDLIDMGLELCE